MVKFLEKPLIFEGIQNEQYKTMKNKWIRLSIVSCLLPLLLTIIISWYNGKFELIKLFGQGEIVLSLFSLTVPLMFDLFEIKKNENKYISRAFLFCLILVIFQILFYCLMKVDNSKQHLLKSFLTSIPFVLSSWGCCIYSIKAMYKYSSMEV